MEDPRVREGLLWEKTDNKIKCKNCERLCNIKPGQVGFCKTRKNINGKLFTLVYGDTSSISVNPIEKKPFFHFWPGSKTLTVGTWSCNFTCGWCQNYDISKTVEQVGTGEYISPEDLIKLAEKNNCQGTSISFNEPTLLLEYSLDVFKLAKKKGLYNTYVSNGYMTQDALKMLVDDGLDAMNVDIKGDKEFVTRQCGADMDKVWRNVKEAKELGVWIELTTLVIPKFNDSDKSLLSIAKKIAEIDKNIPWHVSRFYPAYKFEDVPVTSSETLEKAYRIGKKAGLRFIYVGNILGHKLESTYCPKCNEKLIERFGFDVSDCKITSDNKCPKCGEKIPIVGKCISL
jgi:pyruvate formate lyase activating enzyme